MFNLEEINPHRLEGRVNLVHFSRRFPSNVMVDNLRVEQVYTGRPYEYLDKTKFAPDVIERDIMLKQCMNIDDYLRQNHISIRAIDLALGMIFRSDDKGPVSNNPEDYALFYRMARPIINYLINKKGHKINELF